MDRRVHGVAKRWTMSDCLTHTGPKSVVQWFRRNLTEEAHSGKTACRAPICKTEKETQMYRTDFWTLWEKARVGCFKRTASKHVYYLG